MAALEAARTAIENAAQLRLRVEVGRLNEVADKVQKSLVYQSSAQLGEFADKVAEIDAKWAGLRARVKQYDAILDVLPAVKTRYGPHMDKLRNRFETLNAKLEESLAIIKEPSKMILSELDEQMKSRLHEASTIQKTVLELIRITPESKRRVLPGIG